MLAGYGPDIELTAAATEWLQIFAHWYDKPFAGGRTGLYAVMHGVLLEITSMPGVTRCRDLTRTAVQHWVNSLVDRGATPEHVRTYLSYLHAFCIWGRSCKFFRSNPANPERIRIPTNHASQAPAKAAPSETRGGGTGTRDEPEETCPVILRGEGLRPIVMGREKEPPSPRVYRAVEVLRRAWPARVPVCQLEAAPPRGAGSGARRNLKKLKGSDPDWDAVINPAGIPYRGWAIIMPAPTSPALCQHDDAHTIARGKAR